MWPLKGFGRAESGPGGIVWERGGLARPAPLWEARRHAYHAVVSFQTLPPVESVLGSMSAWSSRLPT